LKSGEAACVECELVGVSGCQVDDELERTKGTDVLLQVLAVRTFYGVADDLSDLVGVPHHAPPNQPREDGLQILLGTAQRMLHDVTGRVIRDQDLVRCKRACLCDASTEVADAFSEREEGV
jgi:hypothetical protein